MIKRDNVIPNTWPGRPGSLGENISVSGIQTKSMVSAIAQARLLAARDTGILPDTALDVQRLLLAGSIPSVYLPPTPAYQSVNNTNTTDYGCGAQALNHVDEVNNQTPVPIPPPVPVVTVLNVYLVNQATPVAGPTATSDTIELFDKNTPVQQLIAGRDFYVNLRITPSINKDGEVPTKFKLTVKTGDTVYTGPSDFDGWAAGSNAASYSGDYFLIPGSYITEVGTATLTFSAGQKGVDPVFGQGTFDIEVVSDLTLASSHVLQDFWYEGVVSNDRDIVKSDVELEFTVKGPANKPFVYTTPWETGTDITDADGNAIIKGPSLPPGVYETQIKFDQTAEYYGQVEVIAGTVPEDLNQAGYVKQTNTGTTSSVGLQARPAIIPYNNTIGGVGDGGTGENDTVDTSAANTGLGTPVGNAEFTGPFL